MSGASEETLGHKKIGTYAHTDGQALFQRCEDASDKLENEYLLFQFCCVGNKGLPATKRHLE